MSRKDIQELQCTTCTRQFSNKYRLNCHIYIYSSEQTKLKAMKDEKYAFEEAKHNDVGDVVELEKPNIIKTENGFDSNTLPQFESENKWTDKMEPYFSHFQEEFQLIKPEESCETNAPETNKPEKYTSTQIDIGFSIDIIDCKHEIQFIKKENEVHCSSACQLETDILPPNHEISSQVFHSENVDNNYFSTNVTELQTEKTVPKDIVRSENSRFENSCPEEAIAHETYDDKISENQSAYTQDILERCKVNCHVPGCQTKCSSLATIWQHFKKDHHPGRKPFKCSVCFEKFHNKKSLQFHIRKYYSFRCPVCSKTKTNSCDLRRHVILTHLKEQPFNCSRCPKKFATSGKLKAHEDTHNNKKEYACGICSMQFFSHHGLYLHLRNHEDTKELRCCFCTKQFSSNFGLKRHVDSCGPKWKKYQNCLNTFKNKTNALHKTKLNDTADILDLENRNKKKVVMECDSNSSPEKENESTDKLETYNPNSQDAFEFFKVEEESEKYIQKLDVSIKFEEKDDKIDSDNLHCPESLIKVEKVSDTDAPNKPEKDTSIQMYMNFSIKVIDSKEQLQSVDNSQFNTNSTEVKTEISTLTDIVKLENHTLDNYSSEEANADESNDQNNENQSAYTWELLERCKVNCHVAGCQTRSSNLNQIWEHFRKEHLSVKKPYKCSVCFELFDHQKSLQLHIKKYYSFQCPVCFKIKTRSCDLKRHIIETHCNERPFKCSKCPKTFRRPTCLKAHEITHNFEKNFVCSICAKAFFSFHALYLHIKSHKNI